MGATRPTALLLLSLLPLAPLGAQTAAADPFAPLSFLQGTWDANVGEKSAVHLTGRYAFLRELDGHVLVRHSTSDPGCQAPVSFDCKHTDMLLIFADRPGTPLRADYFDSEGHVIHYDVSTPTPASVVFLSQPGPGPQFRLSYQLQGSVLSGRFESHMPGEADWHTYLAWSGERR
jgi:hypothetical protein